MTGLIKRLYIWAISTTYYYHRTSKHYNKLVINFDLQYTTVFQK